MLGIYRDRSQGKIRAHRGIAVVLGITALVCVTGVVLAGQLLWTMHSAQNCVESLHSLVPGKSSLADAEALRHTYAKFSRVSGDCRQECSIGFVFESWLSHLHVTGLSQFQAHVYVKDGSIAVVDLLYVKRDSIMVSAKEHSAEADPNNLGFSVLVQDQRAGASRLRLKMATSTPLEVRRTPMSVNLSCMGRFTSCRNAQEIIPDLQSLKFADHS